MRFSYHGNAIIGDCGSRGPPFEPGWRYQWFQDLIQGTRTERPSRSPKVATSSPRRVEDVHRRLRACERSERCVVSDNRPRHGRVDDNAPCPRRNAYAMIRRRAADSGIETKIGNHTFRATGITAYSQEWRHA